MAYRRTAIPFFELDNAAYVSAEVSFFQVDNTTNERLTTLITLYAGKTGSTTVSNPYTLDSDGKFSAPVYAEERFIAVITSIDGAQHETGIWEPALSAADVTAAAASATAAAASATAAAASATTSAGYATAAAASATDASTSATLAAALVGTVYAGTTDVSSGRLIAKITVSGLASLTDATTSVIVGVPAASNVQALAKSSVTTALTPGNLAALNADTVTTGLVRFATNAEATTQTATNAALTPYGMSLGLGNTLTDITMLKGNSYTVVSSGADITMSSGTRYRFTATAAAAVSHPTTVNSTYCVFVEMAPTTAGNTMTIKANGNTVDGVTTNDTYTLGIGPIIQYSGTAANTITSRLAGSLPT